MTKRISQLPAATDPLAPGDMLEGERVAGLSERWTLDAVAGLAVADGLYVQGGTATISFDGDDPLSTATLTFPEPFAGPAVAVVITANPPSTYSSPHAFHAYDFTSSKATVSAWTITTEANPMPAILRRVSWIALGPRWPGFATRPAERGDGVDDPA